MPRTKKNVEKGKGSMTVSEAGRKGGETVAKEYGKPFYKEIGTKGGQKVRRLIEEGEKEEHEKK